MYMHPRHGNSLPPPRNLNLDRWDAAGLAGIAALLIALVSPAAVRTFLVSAGLLGVASLRFSAARHGWARRGQY